MLQNFLVLATYTFDARRFGNEAHLCKYTVIKLLWYSVQFSFFFRSKTHSDLYGYSNTRWKTMTIKVTAGWMPRELLRDLVRGCKNRWHRREVVGRSARVVGVYEKGSPLAVERKRSGRSFMKFSRSLALSHVFSLGRPTQHRFYYWTTTTTGTTTTITTTTAGGLHSCLYYYAPARTR